MNFTIFLILLILFVFFGIMSVKGFSNTVKTTLDRSDNCSLGHNNTLSDFSHIYEIPPHIVYRNVTFSGVHNSFSRRKVLQQMKNKIFNVLKR